MMKIEEFFTGLEFYTTSGKWRCTDIGSRVIVAIQIDHVVVCRTDKKGEVTKEIVTDDKSWFHGPPYAVAAHVFDEFDMAGSNVTFSNRD